MYRDNESIIPFAKPHPSTTRQGRLRQESAYKQIVGENPDIEFDTLRRCYFNKPSEWKSQAEKFGLGSHTQWPEVFYAVQQTPYDEKYKSFRLDRDMEREKKLFDSLNLPEKYTLVIRDSRKYKFDFKLNSKFYVLNPMDYVSNGMIFDWCTVIENASEIHTIDTSWLHLIKVLKVKVPKFYWEERPNGLSFQYVNDDHDNGWIPMRSFENLKSYKDKYWLK